MKHLNFRFLLSLLMSMVGIQAFAHDIEVTNEQGVTIYYTFINDGTELEVSFRGDSYDSYADEYSGEVVIPDTVIYDEEEYWVTSIGDFAFWGCRSLTSVNIPESVTTIGNRSFYGCSGLKTIAIPDGVTSIGYGTFSGCERLTSITIPSGMTAIGKSAFDGCYNLTSVHISDLTAWCNIVFDNYSSNPLSCAHHLFVNDVEVKDLVIDSSVKKVSDYAFYNCTGLRSIKIPSGVTSIGGSAFSGCNGLTSIENPSSVTAIGDGAFEGCI